MLRRILLVWIITFVALSIAVSIGDYFENLYDLEFNERVLIQAIIMSGIIIPAIVYLTNRLENFGWEKVGFQGIRNNLKLFLIGVGLVIAPFLISVIIGSFFGGYDLEFNFNGPIISALFMGIVSVILYEAIPEELVFRGYIYGKLSTKLKKWQASIISVLLFVSIPITLAVVQKDILGLDISIGGRGSITLPFIITVFLFGAFLQYLRVLTNSVTICMGFHFSFVFSNRILGIDSDSLIQMTNLNSQTPLTVSLIVCNAIILIGLIYYPKYRGIKVGWREIP